LNLPAPGKNICVNSHLNIREATMADQDYESMTDEQRQERIAGVKAEIQELHKEMPMCSGADATHLEFRIMELEDELVDLREAEG